MYTHIDGTVFIVSFLYTVKQLFAPIHKFQGFFRRSLMVVIHVYLFRFEGIRKGSYRFVDYLEYWDDEKSPLA